MRRAFRIATVTALAAVVASSGEVNANTPQEAVRSLQAEPGMTAGTSLSPQDEDGEKKTEEMSSIQGPLIGGTGVKWSM